MTPSGLCTVAVRSGFAGAGCTFESDADAGPLAAGALETAPVSAGEVAAVGKSSVDAALEPGATLAWPDPEVVLEQAVSAVSAASTRPVAAARRPDGGERRCDVTAHSMPPDRPSRKRGAVNGTALCQAGPVPSSEDARRVDDLDARLLRELDESPRVGVLELSRRLGVARGTVQARLDRLVERGVIATFAPTLDPVALGYLVTAFATLEISQGQGQAVLAHLRAIPEVLEVHTITGPGDMLCRVVARSNADLQRVLDRVTEFPEIVRTSTVIALSNPVRHRVLPLV